jgi:hypothetical protein
LEPSPSRYGAGAGALKSGRPHQRGFWRTPARRHLPCPLSQLITGSRDEPPDGRGRAFAWGDVAAAGATPIRPITGRLSLLPSSYARTSLGTSYDAPTRMSGEIRGFHVPLAYQLDDVGTRLSAGGPLVCARTGERFWTDHTPVGASLSAPLACSGLRRLTAIHFPLTLSPEPWLPTALMLAVAISPRGLITTLSGEATLSQKLPTRELLQGQVLVGYRWQHIGLSSDCSDSTATQATSCRNSPNRACSFRCTRLSRPGT